MFARGWSDVLPLVPPTEERARLSRNTRADPDPVIQLVRPQGAHRQTPARTIQISAGKTSSRRCSRDAVRFTAPRRRGPTRSAQSFSGDAPGRPLQAACAR
jgi:hypothetical protein